jgi:hypothetical protein
VFSDAWTILKNTLGNLKLGLSDEINHWASVRIAVLAKKKDGK